jgi:hypothetical protein
VTGRRWREEAVAERERRRERRRHAAADEGRGGEGFIVRVSWSRGRWAVGPANVGWLAQYGFVVCPSFGPQQLYFFQNYIKCI